MTSIERTRRMSVKDLGIRNDLRSGARIGKWPGYDHNDSSMFFLYQDIASEY